MKRPAIGQRVRTRKILSRHYVPGRPPRKEWLPTSYRHIDGWIGYYIGYRTLSNGRVDYGDDYTAYYPDQYFEAWLIVPSDTMRPFKARPEDIEILEGDE